MTEAIPHTAAFSSSAGHSATNTHCTGQLLPLMDAMELLQGRWTFGILLALWYKPLRFGAIRRELGTVSHKVLAKHLRQLELHHIITRCTPADTQGIATYAVTDYGRTLQAAIFALRDWGIQHRKHMMADS